MEERRAAKVNKEVEQWDEQEEKWEGRIKDMEKQEEKWEGRIKDMEEQEEKWEGRTEEQEKQEEKWEGRTGERRKRKEKREKQFHLTGSVPAKIIAFFLLAISCFGGVGMGILCIMLGTEGFYTGDLDTVLSENLWGMGCDAVYDVEVFLNQGLVKEAEEYCRDRNVDIELVEENEDGSLDVIWGTWDGTETELTGATYSEFSEMEKKVTVNGHTLKSDTWYLYRFYIDPEFPIEDEYREMAKLLTFLYDARFTFIAPSAGGLFLALICFIFLMCSAGHRNGQVGIVPGVLTGIHLDVLTLFFWGAAIGFGSIVVEISSSMYSYGNWWQLIILTAAGSLLAVWTTLYCMEFALRAKMGKCWRHSLIYVTFRGIGRMLRFLCRETGNLIRGIPMMLTALTV